MTHCQPHWQQSVSKLQNNKPTKPERPTKIKKLILTAALTATASILAMADEATPEKAAAIEKAYGVKYMSQTTSVGGTRIWWRFAYYDKKEQLLESIPFPADGTVEQFKFCFNYATTAIYAHIHHVHPEGESINVDVPVLDQILSTKDVLFLGVLSDRNYNAQWAFRVDARGDCPSVIVIVPAGSTFEQFHVAYIIASRAVMDYEDIKAAEQKEKKNT